MRPLAAFTALLATVLTLHLAANPHPGMALLAAFTWWLTWRRWTART